MGHDNTTMLMYRSFLSICVRQFESTSDLRLVRVSASSKSLATLLTGLLLASAVVFSQEIAPVSADTPITPEPGIIAFYRGSAESKIYVMNSDGTDQTNVSGGAGPDADPALSPDGTRIAFTSYRDPTSQIYVMNSDGTDQTNVSYNAEEDYYPNWSPNGTKIVYTRFVYPFEQVWIMNADGSGQAPLTTEEVSESRPVFSPDGSKIAFTRFDGINSDIHVMEADGDYLDNLSDMDGFDSDAAWSPDGSQIAFASDRNGDFEVYVMNADGSEQTNLSNNDAWDSLPSWSPDGSQIVFHSTREGPFQIYLMNADGSEQTNIGNSEVDDSDPSWAYAAPPNHPPLSDLVSWYRAEGNADDSAGNNDGVELSTDGGVDYVPGVMGDSFEFSIEGLGEGGDWIEIDDDPSLNFGTGSFSVGAWINRAISAPMNIMVHGGSGCVDPIEAGWVLGIGATSAIPSGDLGFDLRDEGGEEGSRPIVTAMAPDADEWHYITAVVDRDSDIVYLYIDGGQVDTAAIPEGFGSADNDGKPAIGANNRGGDWVPPCVPAGFFDGNIDEVTLHSRALSAAEIQATYEAGTVLINNGDATTTSPDVTVTMVCHDAGSGCSDIELVFANIDANLDDDIADTIPIDVTGDSNPVVETLNAMETGLNTAIFVLPIELTSDGAGDSILFNDGDQITATGLFFDSAAGTKSVEVIFTDEENNSVAQRDSIELVDGVQPTTLTLNAMPDVTATTGFTVSGNLTNADTGEPLTGQLITFIGTGVTPSLLSVTTDGVDFTGSSIDIVSCPIPADCGLDEVGSDPDPDDNMVLHLPVDGKITFPEGTVTVKLYIQDMGTSTFKYVVEEGNGDPQPVAQSNGLITPDVNIVQIISGYTLGIPNGIKEITITEIVGNPTVGIAAIITGNPDGQPIEQHQINFEEFTPGLQTSPFTVNGGHYFSTGFSQNIDAIGLDVTAQFSGSPGFNPDDSDMQFYDVLANTQGIGGEGSQNSGTTTGGSITVPGNTGADSDQDGIPDSWENTGVPYGTAIYRIGGSGNPNPSANTDGFATVGLKDIFVEVDCMAGTPSGNYCPTTTATTGDIARLKAAFSAEGYVLHVVVNENNLSLQDPFFVWTNGDANLANDFDNVKKDRLGTLDDRERAVGTPTDGQVGSLRAGSDYLEAKALVFHYGLFVKNIGATVCPAQNPNGISGQAELNGNDFIVSLGCGFTGQFGSPEERQGTFMHELGHNLGLRHGGGDDDNCKPNLISVMSYPRQMPWAQLSATTANGQPTQWALTFSREALIPLNENNGLVEGNGLTIIAGQWTGTLASGSTSFKIIWGNPTNQAQPILTGNTGSPVNWNNAAGAGPYTQDINKIAGVTGCAPGTTSNTNLASFDEWSLINPAALNFRDGATIDGLVYPDPDTTPELTTVVLQGATSATSVGPDNISLNNGISVTPDVAVADSDDNGNNEVYAVWSDTTGGTSGNFDILFKKSIDGGETFDTVKNISTNSGTSITPRIAVSGSSVFVIWSDTSGGTSGKFDILFRRSLDGGTNWGPIRNISTNSGDSLTPHVAADGANVYAIWSDKTGGVSNNFDILFKKSINSGDAFSVTATKMSNNAGESLTPSIGVSGNTLYAVWSDTTGGTSGKFDILMKTSGNSGGSFSASATNISTNSGHSLTPYVAVDPLGAYVVWSDTTGGTSGKFDILMKQASLGGAFGAVKNISTNSGTSVTPRVAASGTDVFVAWSDTTGGTSGNFDILVKKSSDLGISFGAVSNISTDSGLSATPGLAIDSPYVYVAWGDLTSLKLEIKYASKAI